ncbi:MAG: glutamine synthetase [Thermoguttaceae bacterium]|nr:glutamine synthetase [Thermoguttaceae bacterium]
MKYSKDEVSEFVREEDVKFVRLAFCDVFGALKNIAIMPDELQRAFECGISFDASSIAGFGDERRSDLFLVPEPDTLTILPWRPEHGRVVRMFCEIRRPDGSPFEADSRYLLKKAVDDARKQGCRFYFGSEQEFYLFELDERGKPTKIPYDDAGYMDVYPADKGENVRREICLTLEQMGFRPESSHHEQGPGQNEVDFRFADPLTTADNTISFQFVAKTVARRNGLCADFSAKPLEKKPGNGFHINMSVDVPNVPNAFQHALAGILAKIEDVTAFLNPTEDSYKRLGQNQAPRYVSWARENRSQLIRVPAAFGEFRRLELRSPDPTANPYLTFALLVYAALEGIEKRLDPGEEADVNMYRASAETLAAFRKLPNDLELAKKIAYESEFVRAHVPADVVDCFCGK